MSQKSIDLRVILSGHAAEIEGMVAGIRSGRPMGMDRLRPVARKDDPPEED